MSLLTIFSAPWWTWLVILAMAVISGGITALVFSDFDPVGLFSKPPKQFPTLTYNRGDLTATQCGKTVTIRRTDGSAAGIVNLVEDTPLTALQLSDILDDFERFRP
ncbi:MAG: hypothetical protein IJX39_08795 [Clostridia bacterium]|nr:hypothetical protein [Clostridia bacterium]